MEVFWTRQPKPLLPFFLLLFFVSTATNKINGQVSIISNEHDTNYIASYIEDFTTRVFSAVSYSSITLSDQNLDKDLVYEIPSRIYFGAGFNYSVIGINLAFSPFKNSTLESEYGETKSFDFRLNFYGRKIIYDFYLMSHRGFYMSNPEDILYSWPDTSKYPTRPDMELFSTGLVAQYLFNNKKFSMRATYMQNEWQKKSAGSFIAGGEFFYSHLHGDSSFIPDQVNPPEFMDGYHFNHSSSLNLGLNGGYSHTFVIKKHVFLAIGLSLGPQLSYSVVSSETDSPQRKESFTWGINALLRAGLGYNSRRVYVGMFFISENLSHELAASQGSSLFSTGIFKLNVAYRFSLKKPIKLLNPNYWKFLQPKKSE